MTRSGVAPSGSENRNNVLLEAYAAVLHCIFYDDRNGKCLAPEGDIYSSSTVLDWK